MEFSSGVTHSLCQDWDKEEYFIADLEMPREKVLHIWSGKNWKTNRVVDSKIFDRLSAEVLQQLKVGQVKIDYVKMCKDLVRI